MEPVAEKLAKTKEKSKVTERICLGLDEATKVQGWLEQVNKSSKGFLTLSKSDVVNFIIRELKGDLTSKETQKIKAYHYDPIKHLNWITPRLKDALMDKDNIRIAEIQEEIRGIELAVIQRADAKISSAHQGIVTPPDTRKKRSKKDLKETPSNSIEPTPLAETIDIESAHKNIL